jgi:hypothetical protein
LLGPPPDRDAEDGSGELPAEPVKQNQLPDVYPHENRSAKP